MLKAAAAGAVATAIAPWQGAAAAGDVVQTAITPRVLTLSGAGGNITVLTTGAGKVLVDSGSADSSDVVLQTLDELPGDGVSLVFNTHWHPDQVGSNASLGEAGATIIAHAKTRQRLRAGYYLRDEERYEPGLPEAGLPAETFFRRGTRRIAEQPIEFGYLLEAHTDGDIFVAFPEENVIVAGDAVSSVRDPLLDWFGGGWLGGRVDSLALLLELSDDETQFVPGFGPAIRRSDVEAEHDVLLELFERMVEHVRLGETADDMLDAGILDGLGRTFEDPYRLIYSAHKGFWAHHNKLMPDIV